MFMAGTSRMARSLLLLLFLGTVSRVLASADGGPAAASVPAMNGANSKVTVFWFEDLSRPGQVERARQVEEEILRSYDESDVRFIGVVKEASGTTSSSSPPSTGTGGYWISFLSFADLHGDAVRSAASRLGLSSRDGAPVLQRVGMVLLNRRGCLLIREAPLSLSEAMSDVRATVVATKVDESTWGKIKELFR